MGEQPQPEIASLPAAHRDVLVHYLRDLADLMQLRDWSVKVMHATPQEHGDSGPGVGACVDSDQGSYEARFYFRPDVLEWDDDTVRLVCVHELVHVHRRGIALLHDRGLRQELPAMAWTMYITAYQVADEQATEALALVLAPHLPPFPGWPQEGAPPSPQNHPPPSVGGVCPDPANHPYCAPGGRHAAPDAAPQDTTP